MTIDPIMFAIERHRWADANYNAAIGADQSEDKKQEACDEEQAAAWNLVDTLPSTVAGVRALCSYLAEREEKDDPISPRRDPAGTRQFVPRLLGNIAAALEKIEQGR